MSNPCTKCGGTGRKQVGFLDRPCRWCGGSGDDTDRVRRIILEQIPPSVEAIRARAKLQLAQWLAKRTDSLIAKSLFKDKE